MSEPCLVGASAAYKVASTPFVSFFRAVDLWLTAVAHFISEIVDPETACAARDDPLKDDLGALGAGPYEQMLYVAAAVLLAIGAGFAEHPDFLPLLYAPDWFTSAGRARIREKIAQRTQARYDERQREADARTQRYAEERARYRAEERAGIDTGVREIREIVDDLDPGDHELKGLDALYDQSEDARLAYLYQEVVRLKTIVEHAGPKSARKLA